MKKVISRKGIILIVIPIFAIFLQVFLRLILDKDLNTIGITFGALGLAQVLPFFYFDHFIANKVLGVSPEYDDQPDQLSIVYKLSKNIPKEDIEKIKNLFILAIFFNLGLFIVTVYLGLTERIFLHILFGALSCIVSWYLLVFK